MRHHATGLTIFVEQNCASNPARRRALGLVSTFRLQLHRSALRRNQGITHEPQRQRDNHISRVLHTLWKYTPFRTGFQCRVEIQDRCQIIGMIGRLVIRRATIVGHLHAEVGDPKFGQRASNRIGQCRRSSARYRLSPATIHFYDICHRTGHKPNLDLDFDKNSDGPTGRNFAFVFTRCLRSRACQGLSAFNVLTPHFNKLQTWRQRIHDMNRIIFAFCADTAHVRHGYQILITKCIAFAHRALRVVSQRKIGRLSD
ncbi:MAG TPA: hypothetical protein VGY76_00065 [Solirubrobacteraceae bacterium]|nr:hypothetical protein [Solirubrobacteraceae bacterium]